MTTETRPGVVSLVCDRVSMSLAPGAPIENVKVSVNFPVDPEQARLLADMLLQPVRVTVTIEETHGVGAS